MVPRRLDRQKIADPRLCSEWLHRLSAVQQAMDRLNAMKLASDGDPLKSRYVEAVEDYARARDAERGFFWHAFFT